MAEHANEALPGLALFIAQRAAQIRDDEQLVREPCFAKISAMNFPAAGFSGKRDLLDARRVAGEAFGKAELARVSSEKALFRLIQNALAGAIHEAKRAVAVECKNRDVDFLHHFAEQRGGFESAESLLAKRFAERVHFAQHFAERIAFIGAAGANRKIAFAQSGEKIRNVRSGNTTRLCAVNAKLSHVKTISTVSVHCSFEE